MAQLAKNPSAMQKTWIQSLGWEDPLEKGKATHSSILAWRISWAVQCCKGCCKESDMTERISLHFKGKQDSNFEKFSVETPNDMIYRAYNSEM